MTLAIVLRGSNGMVLGTDSRVSRTGPKGLQSEDTSEKFLQVNRDIGVMTYGLAVPGYDGISRLASVVRTRKLASFREIERTAEAIFKQTWRRWAATVVKQGQPVPAVGVGYIMAGYDSVETNQFRVVHWYSPNFAAEERQDILAAEWHSAQYLVNKLYHPQMSVGQLKEFVVFLLSETMTVAQTVGGPLQLAAVTLDTGFQRIDPVEISGILTRNERRYSQLHKEMLELFA